MLAEERERRGRLWQQAYDEQEERIAELAEKGITEVSSPGGSSSERRAVGLRATSLCYSSKHGT